MNLTIIEGTVNDGCLRAAGAAIQYPPAALGWRFWAAPATSPLDGWIPMRGTCRLHGSIVLIQVCEHLKPELERRLTTRWRVRER